MQLGIYGYTWCIQNLNVRNATWNPWNNLRNPYIVHLEDYFGTISKPYSIPTMQYELQHSFTCENRTCFHINIQIYSFTKVFKRRARWLKKKDFHSSQKKITVKRGIHNKKKLMFFLRTKKSPSFRIGGLELVKVRIFLELRKTGLWTTQIYLFLTAPEEGEQSASILSPSPSPLSLSSAFFINEVTALRRFISITRLQFKIH